MYVCVYVCIYSSIVSQTFTLSQSSASLPKPENSRGKNWEKYNKRRFHKHWEKYGKRRSYKHWEKYGKRGSHKHWEYSKSFRAWVVRPSSGTTW